MVDSGVWDNTVFIHHWNHIIQAAPITPEGQNLRESIDDVLWFPEYSDDYKHEQYTLGFSGRPGGPEFYINLSNNTDIHGPGKQGHSTVLNDADACFARVVLGKRTVDRLRKMSDIARNDPNVGISLTTIVKAKRVPQRQKKKKIHSYKPMFSSTFLNSQKQ